MSNSSNQATILALMILTTSVCIASTDLYAPSLPHLPEFFSTSAGIIKLTMSLNLLGFALGQLVLGPISDRVGRRPTMLIGVLGYCVFSFACAHAPDAFMLIVFRILQGGFAAVEASVGLAIIYESFDKEARFRALALFGIAFAVTPAIAPIVGGYMHIGFGWQSNFLLVAGLGVAVLAALWRWLPETGTPQTDALNPSRLLRNAKAILTNPRFVLPTTIVSSFTATVFCYITVAPFLLIEVFGVSTEHFGYYHLVTVLAYIVGSLCTRQAMHHFKAALLLRTGIGISISGLLAMILITLTDNLNALSLTASASLLFFGMGPAYAIAPAQAMSVTGDGPGLGSALLHTIQMLFAGLAASMVSLEFGSPATPLLTVLASIVLFATAVSLLLAPQLRSGAPQ